MPRTAHETHGASTLTQAESRARTLLPPAVAQLNGALASALAGRFRVERVLGMGASGVVFRAFDREVAQWLAIKVLYRCEPHRLYRLKREFRALSEIAHENLVGVHELFVMPSGHAFFSMDLVHDAASFLEYHRAQDPSRLHASLVQLVRGVQHLHARGKLHRDLKPSNVLIDGEHRLRIVDFGLVGSLDEPVFGAEPAPIFEGTPAYAAPEQIDVRNTTPASDWYAIGVMLYEVLAGARPFEARGGDLMQLKASEDPAPPSSLARWPVPPALERVCMRLLERDPARRADGRELLCALDAHAPLALDAREWPFVGREAELRALEQAFTAARRPTLIEGASGVGKTSLAQRFLDSLEHAGRALVLRSRCFVFESV
ncbi:MAG TPA: serine/threonine-protein kinase, partial [Polyangiales bacterium]|nr:serine/threonine-protein kinase [Polyangiales bacterium]